MNCSKQTGIHYWDDYIYIEIVDPATGEVLPDGEMGEIVITTLVKEGAPLIRFRTHDLSRIIPGECSCGSPYPRIDIIAGRTDDMLKVKGVNMFPSQIEDVISMVDGASSEYQVLIRHENGKDIMTLSVEVIGGAPKEEVAKRLAHTFKSRIGMTPIVNPVDIGALPRSEKKTKRVIDERYE